MATWKKYYMGDRGPFYYDADRSINDPDGDFSGESEQGFLSDGPIKADSYKASSESSDPDSLTTNNQVDQKINNASVSLTTQTVTVVTGVDFAAETVTTQDITFVTDISISS